MKTDCVLLKCDSPETAGRIASGFAALIILAFTAQCCVATIRSHQGLVKLPRNEAASAMPVSLKGVVTFTRPGGFVMAPTELRDRNSVFIITGESTLGAGSVAEGNTFIVEDSTCVWNSKNAVHASQLVRTGKVKLPYPDIPKFQDVRKGWRNLRRARVNGRIAAVDVIRDTEINHQVTIYTLSNWQEKIPVRVTGVVEGTGTIPSNVSIDLRLLSTTDLTSDFSEITASGTGSGSSETFSITPSTVPSCEFFKVAIDISAS